MLAAGAFNEGMRDLLSTSGDESNLILLGAGSEESLERSQIPLATETIAASIRGIQQRGGLPAVSGEIVYMGMISAASEEGSQGLTRGVTPAALEVHRKVRIIEGNWPGSGEVLVGRLAHHHLGVDAVALAVGETIDFEGESFRVAGIFDAMGTVMESEIWFDRSDLMAVIQRETLSSVVVRMANPEGRAFVDLFAKQRLDLELAVISEREYYDKLSRFYGPIRGITWLTAILVAIGAVMGGLNIMYASYANRVRELGTLQTLGYRRHAILWSLIQEALFIQFLGLALCLSFGLLILDGWLITFSMGTFLLDLSPPVLLLTTLTGILLGTFGSLPPAIRCLSLTIPKALKAAT
jgi:ABC-type lipoprotein release transport system permease subunit